MKKLPLFFLVVLLTATGCMKKPLEPVLVTIPERKIDYLKEVKPLLDKRCVVCHSCYNSPCQLKLSSYEGVDRGATKKAVYDAHRLRTMDPTRLFTDAVRTEQWRDKGFFSVTESSASGTLNDSIMLQLLSHKMENPISKGEYRPEADDLSCSKDGSELSSYLSKHPNRGMPFGFPPLKQDEFELIAGWLVQGAKGPTASEQEKLEAIDPLDMAHVKKWTDFFNTQDPKFVMTARYLYEHLFLAHIRFGSGTNDFYELVRSKTPPGEPLEVIPTVRPYDNPGGEFYYRFRKIHSTIVHKTHMVFTLDDKAYARYYEIFIEPEWLEEPAIVNLWGVDGADPFTTFRQIPPRSRYQFLLDNSHYIIMTYIRVPVCKGQVALNVIHDHFWLLFLDPEFDLSVRYPAFLKLHREKLVMPAELGSDFSLLKVVGNSYHKRAMDFHKVRHDFYMSHYYNGMGYDAIWKGNRSGDAPLLTVFRHFDSASVHRGALGSLPRTVWVFDYPLLERVYYSLVAGFDVYGKVWHQLTTRFYMDALRREGESNFIDFLPHQHRKDIMSSWYQGMDFFHVDYHETEMPAKISASRDNSKREFLENLITKYFPAEQGIQLDMINYEKSEQVPEIPARIKDENDVLAAFHAVAGPGDSFFSRVDNHDANVAYIRVKMDASPDLVISAVIHRWHDNVTMLFGEKKNLDPAKDTADFFKGFIGSYPNYFFEVELKDIREFVLLLKNFKGTPEDAATLRKFGVNRSDKNFWEVYDWFQNRFLNDDPIRAGLFDLNRYYHNAL